MLTSCRCRSILSGEPEPPPASQSPERAAAASWTPSSGGSVTKFEKRKMRNPKLLAAAAGWRSTTSLPPHMGSLSQNTTNTTVTGEEDKMAYWPGLAWDLAFASMILVSIVGNSTVLLIIISESLHVTFLTFCKLLLIIYSFAKKIQYILSTVFPELHIFYFEKYCSSYAISRT